MLQLKDFEVHDPKFLDTVQKSVGVAKLVEALAKELIISDEAVWTLFQSHIQLNGQVVLPNITLEEALTTVNNVAKQENVQPSRLAELLFNKDTGLLSQSGLLSLPLYQFRYASGAVDSQNRNRMYLLGYLVLLACLYAVRNLGVTPEAAKAAAMRQRIAVLELSYALDMSRIYYNYNSMQVLNTNDFRDALDGASIIHFNGSRAVQDDEKLAVALSQKGIDVTSKESLRKGYVTGKLSNADYWTLRSLAHLWEMGGGKYEVINTDLSTPTVYTRRMPEVMSSIVTLVYRCLHGWETGFRPGNHSLRSALAGVVFDTKEPGESSKTGKWSTPKPNLSQYDEEYFNDALYEVWVRRSPEAWENLMGEAVTATVDMNLFELATHIFYQHNEASIFSRQLSIRKVDDNETQSAPKFPKIGNALLHILSLIEQNADTTSDLFSGVEMLLGLNVYIERGEDETTEVSTISSAAVANVQNLLNLVSLDLEGIEL